MKVLKRSGKTEILTRIQTPKTTFTVDYPEAVDFMNQQQSVFWPHFEVKVHKDKQDILVNMTEAERHGTITTLKLFSKYEMVIGNEFWLNFVMKKFPRPEIQSMAAFNGAMEMGVHLFFYKTLNEELGIATDSFYNEYLEDPELTERVEFLEDTLSAEDDLRALGCFTFGEGAILYSSFAFLKHFQSQGKNKLINVVSGINFSARDENLHSEAAAWLFRTLLAEKKEAGLISQEEEERLKQDILKAANTVLDHEKAIIRKLFEKGRIEGITDVQLEHFAMSRINLCLRNLGYENLFKVEYNPVSDWFYKGINGYSQIDFFNSQGNQYSRDWDSNAFRF
jgi:ribonucleoside-diphosphate reductase beta chain